MSSPSLQQAPQGLFSYHLQPHVEDLLHLRKRPRLREQPEPLDVATKRRFNPNLQRVRMMLNGKATRAYVCTRCLKAGKVTKAV